MLGLTFPRRRNTNASKVQKMYNIPNKQDNSNQNLIKIMTLQKTANIGADIM